MVEAVSRAEAATRATDGVDLGTSVTRPADDTALLTVEGEIDTLTVPRFVTAIAQLVGESATLLVVDLTGVTFMGSSGLAALVQAAHDAERSDRRIRIVAQGRPVLRPLQITGTDQLFDIHSDLASALAPDGACD